MINFSVFCVEIRNFFTWNGIVSFLVLSSNLQNFIIVPYIVVSYKKHALFFPINVEKHQNIATFLFSYTFIRSALLLSLPFQQ